MSHHCGKIKKHNYLGHYCVYRYQIELESTGKTTQLNIIILTHEGDRSASALHFLLVTVPEPLPVSPLAGPKCAGLLSSVSYSSEKLSEVSSDSGYRARQRTSVQCLRLPRRMVGSPLASKCSRLGRRPSVLCHLLGRQPSWF